MPGSDPSEFNLASDPWIPFGGDTLSLEAAAAAAADLPAWPDGEPLFGPMLMRVLVPAAYRACELDDPRLTDAEFAARQAGMLDRPGEWCDRLAAYFADRRGQFRLAGDGPLFAQDRALSAVAPHPIAKLVTGWASGANPMLGEPRSSVPMRTAARCLLIARGYSAGGTHTKHPVMPGKGRFLGGPLRGTLSLHPAGRTLAATIAAHLVPLGSAPSAAGHGLPFWEQPPADPLAPPTGPAGLLEQISVRQDKTMLLRSGAAPGWADGFTIAEGPGVHLPLAAEDPYVLVGADAQPRKPRLGRAIWREAESLLAQSGVENSLTAPVLDWALAAHARAGYDRAGIGWTVATHLGDKSKELIWGCAAFPGLLAIFDADTAARATAFFEACGDAERAMTKQIASAWYRAGLMPSGPGGKASIYAPARTEFWGRAEPAFWDAVAGRLRPTAVDIARANALAGYDRAVASLEAGRHLLAVLESRFWLERWPQPDRAAAADGDEADDTAEDAA